MSRKYIILLLLTVVLFVAGLAMGSVSIPLSSVVDILTGGNGGKDSWRYIVVESRLPQTLTALMAGGALAVSGLLLQTAFGNPLAAPDIFGITSGASLMVALVTLGGSLYTLPLLVQHITVVAAAFIGAMAVTVLIWMLGRMVRSNVVLIIIGIMVGYLASSAITLLNFFASEEGVKYYAVWGMGSFGNVSLDQLPFFVTVCVLATASTLLLIKPLNALLLGERYAENLGINVRATRNALMLITGLITATVTAYCGPVAFIALAVPHIARMIIRTQNHRQLLPVTLLAGCVVALFCNVMTALPGESGLLPLNAVTPLIGAPVIIYVIMKR
jgi:iron complex transport system permease protein